MVNIIWNRCLMMTCAFLFATVASQSLAAEPKQGGRVIVSYGVGEPKHFNPAVASGSATAIIGAQIFASPLRYDENCNPKPYLARSWEFSKDGLSLTLHLVKGAIFHDGRPITSEDLAFSILTVQKYHPFKPMFAPVERVDTPDPLTAVIRLSRPHPAILLAMSPPLLPILPQHIYGDGRDLKTHPANLKTVGSGPFKLVNNVPGKYLVLKRNGQFFIPGRPYLDEIIIRYDYDPNAQLIYMERQDAHILPLFIDLEGLERLGKKEHIVITPAGHEGLGAMNWLAFNLLRKPLDDKRVRQAIAYVIDAAFINKFMNRGRSVRATGPISPFSPFYEPKVAIYDLDPAKAAALLDKAGLPVKPDGTRFSLTLDYIPVVPSQQHDIAFYIKRQLSKVGIDVRVRSSNNFKEWAERVGNWDFDMTMDGVYNWGDPMIGVHRTYLSDNIRKGVAWSNTQNYRNAKVDDILNRAAMEMDVVKRKELYSEFQRIVTDELPIVWLNLIPYQTVYNKGLGNPPLSIWGMHSPLDELYWKEVPVKTYVSTPPLNMAKSTLERVGIQAIILLKEKGLIGALEVFEDEKRGYLDLKKSGLHVIGFTTKGIVFLDNSGKMKPGMDIGGLIDLKGNRLVEQLSGAGGKQIDGAVETEVLWPHPTIHKVGRMKAWCGKLTEDDRVCALLWE
jgi:peptide/nickel transport system substrate-binding protein